MTPVAPVAPVAPLNIMHAGVMKGVLNDCYYLRGKAFRPLRFAWLFESLPVPRPSCDPQQKRLTRHVPLTDQPIGSARIDPSLGLYPPDSWLFATSLGR